MGKIKVHGSAKRNLRQILAICSLVPSVITLVLTVTNLITQN